MREALLADKLPKVQTDVFTLRQEGVETTGQGERMIVRVEVIHANLDTVPRLLFQNSVRCRTHVRLSALLNFIIDLHVKKGIDMSMEDCREIDLSIDGVASAESSNCLVKVVSVSIPCCGTPFIYMVHETNAHGTEAGAKDVLLPIMRDMDQAGVRLRFLRADSKERKTLRAMQSTGAKFGCDFCEQKGIYTHRKVVFPYGGHIGAIRRTNESCRQQGAEALAIGVKKTDHVKGVKGISPLLELEDFDMIKNLPMDSFHNVDEGLFKRLFDEVLEGQDADRERMKGVCDKILKATQLPSETSRRTRSVDCAKWKGNELSVMALVLAPMLFVKGGVLEGEM